MQLVIRIECDNAAFGDDDFECAQELNRILMNYQVKMLRDGGYDALLRDINGQQVGRAVMIDDDADDGATENSWGLAG